MENFKKKAIELVLGLAVTEKKDPAVVPYNPAKLTVSGAEQKYFPRRPGGKGHKYAKLLTDLIQALESERAANIHNILVIKDKEVILEASAPGYGVNVAHLAHSMSKTVCAIAIGMLVDDGKLSLDEKVIDFFPELPYSDSRFADITVEDLLTMKSGVPFGELGTVTSDDWCESFFSSELTSPPGEVFSYNSMNSYIMAKIVTRVTGCSVTEFIKPRLLEPLHIDNFLWELSADGTEKGGFGVYMSCESFAKIGVMLLDLGTFEGQKILSRAFVTKMLMTHSLAQTDKGAFNYGYHIWTSREGNDFLLSGMLGQNVWVCPEHNLVVAINSGNNEIFQDSAALEIVRHCFLELPEDISATRADLSTLKKRVKSFFKCRHWIRPLVPRRGISYLFGIRNKFPFDENWNRVLGEYSFPENNVSLLPLFVSVLQNNYIGGIEKLSILREGDALMLSSVEGGVTYNIPVGLYDFKTCTQNYKGELYTVRAIAEAMEDEDRNPVYKIELIFPELPNTRMIKITHTEDGIMLRLSEMPNQKIAEKFITGMTGSGKIGFALGLLEKRIGENFIGNKLEAVFNPTLLGVDTRREDWETILRERNVSSEERREKAGKFLRTVVSRFVGDNGSADTEEKGKKPKRPKQKKAKSEGFLSRALSSILSKRKSSSDIDVKDYTEIHVSDSDTKLTLIPDVTTPNVPDSDSDTQDE